MGLDLTLCPDELTALYGTDKPPTSDSHLGYSRLRMVRESSLFIAITGLSPQPLAPVQFQWYSDSGLLDLAHDAYGNPLTWLPANVFQRIAIPTTAHTLHPWNRAVLRFLSILPPATRVVLWWD